MKFSGLIMHCKYVHTIENQLNKDFDNLCEFFVDNKLGIRLDEVNIKCMFFDMKYKLKNTGKLNIMHNGMEIKQYSKVTYLGCLLDVKMPGESIALEAYKK